MSAIVRTTNQNALAQGEAPSPPHLSGDAVLPLTYASPRPAADNCDVHRLIDALSHELLHIAMKSAFVALGCNAMTLTPARDEFDVLQGDLPDGPIIYRAIKEELLQLPAKYSSAMAAAHTVYETLSAAQDILQIINARLNLSPSYRLKHSELSDLVMMWRTVCTQFLSAIDAFQRAGMLSIENHETDGAADKCPPRLLQILHEAFSGRTLATSDLARPRPEPPSGLDMRRWKRFHAEAPCSLTVKGMVYSAIIRNISLGGALLERVPPLHRGSRVLISTRCGRSLQGNIAWSVDDKAGVRFDHELAFNDPLLVQGPPAKPTHAS